MKIVSDLLSEIKTLLDGDVSISEPTVITYRPLIMLESVDVDTIFIKPGAFERERLDRGWNHSTGDFAVQIALVANVDLQGDVDAQLSALFTRKNVIEGVLISDAQLSSGYVVNSSLLRIVVDEIYDEDRLTDDGLFIGSQQFDYSGE